LKLHGTTLIDSRKKTVHSYTSNNVPLDNGRYRNSLISDRRLPACRPPVQPFCSRRSYDPAVLPARTDRRFSGSSPGLCFLSSHFNIFYLWLYHRFQPLSI